MIDLHTHSIFSDGELIPAELVRRAVVAGYHVLAITDHGDQSNVEFIIPCIVKFCKKLSDAQGIRVIPGIELTHVPPANICELAKDCRRMGAEIILVHGETIVEPVMSGTNSAALQSPIDILAHPGLITREETRLAAEHSIFLEVTTRRGHSLTNGHVVKMAREANASLVLNTDSHSPRDIVEKDMALRIATGAGMNSLEIDTMFKNSEHLVERIFQRK